MALLKILKLKSYQQIPTSTKTSHFHILLDYVPQGDSCVSSNAGGYLQPCLPFPPPSLPCHWKHYNDIFSTDKEIQIRKFYGIRQVSKISTKIFCAVENSSSCHFKSKTLNSTEVWSLCSTYWANQQRTMRTLSKAHRYEGCIVCCAPLASAIGRLDEGQSWQFPGSWLRTEAWKYKYGRIDKLEWISTFPT